MSYNETFTEEYRPKTVKKIFALVLCAALFFSCFPISVFATQKEANTPKEEVVYISLAAAMLIGRIAAGVFMGLIFSVGEYSLAIWAASYFAGSVPGIIAHLILVPALYAALTKAGLVKRS